MFLVEKGGDGKYPYPDSLKLKTTGYQWFRKNNGGGKILKIKNHASKYTVSGDFNLGDISALWAVTSSSVATDGSKLQDRARERLLHRECPSTTSFEEYAKMRTSCYIIEEKEGDFFCDCYEGSKGKLCKHSVGMSYFVGNMIVEDDVRAVPLGGKRKRGRPKRNPHCLTRSPGQGETAEDVLDANENVADEINVDLDDVQPSQAALDLVQSSNNDEIMADDLQPSQAASDLVQPSNSEEMMTDDIPPTRDFLNSLRSEDLCLQLEDSDSEDDMTIIGADPAFNFKPPKKAKRDVTEVLQAAGGRRRGETGSRAGRRGRGRGTAPTSSSTCSPSSTKGGMSSGRGNSGRPRGSRGGRGRGAAPASRGSPSTTTCGMADGGQGIGSTSTELCSGSPSSITPTSVSGEMAGGSSSRGSRGRPRGSRRGRGRGTVPMSSGTDNLSSSEGIPSGRSSRGRRTRGRPRGSSS